MTKDFTITVYTENQVGLLNRITIIFTKRKINIESLTVSASEQEGIHRYTVVIREPKEVADKVVKQIEGLVDVLWAYSHENDDIIQQQMAIYKIPTKVFAHGGKAEKIVRAHHARVLTMEKDFTVIEKTGYHEETLQLFEDLKPYGIIEFSQSGRVAVSKKQKGISGFMKQNSTEELISDI
ncbi:MAG: acetolactate synthase small subunit [Balneolaceae bacterium]|nr:acetolactate synthase small subunit [Balneolaceae bacterium]